MPRALAFLACVLALAASPVHAAGAAWPPPEAQLARMRALQAVIGDPGSTTAQRDAARAELGALLRSPQARGRESRGAHGAPRRAPARPAPPRAAIQPFPSVVMPAPPPLPAKPPGVAHLEVVEPPKTAVNPQTGSPAVPAGNFAIDPRTGAVLHPVPGGYVDPATGQFVPR